MENLMDKHEFYANSQFFMSTYCSKYCPYLLYMWRHLKLSKELLVEEPLLFSTAAMVLEKRRVQGPNLSATSGDPVLEGKISEEETTGWIEFRALLNLAEALISSFKRSSSEGICRKAMRSIIQMVS